MAKVNLDQADLSQVKVASRHFLKRLGFEIPKLAAIPPGVGAFAIAGTIEKGPGSIPSLVAVLGLGGLAAVLGLGGHSSDLATDAAQTALNNIADEVNKLGGFELTFEFKREKNISLRDTTLFQWGETVINTTIIIDNFKRNQDELSARLNPEVLAKVQEVLEAVEQEFGKPISVAGAPLSVLKAQPKPTGIVNVKPIVVKEEIFDQHNLSSDQYCGTSTTPEAFKKGSRPNCAEIDPDKIVDLTTARAQRSPKTTQQQSQRQ